MPSLASFWAIEHRVSQVGAYAADLEDKHHPDVEQGQRSVHGP